ncbi:hypothetical protein CTI12_AA552630 [Artemisia annua]|uniref:RRM domain-containing protein n=1 Tax=Artemisia annua TaxID=35608 RepID=A0A2U1KXW8_ARTAN|nr:hypothetical protein CTI12_AA552630 [Artemisia annua]
MEGSDWKEVKQRKHRSVFERLGKPLNRTNTSTNFGKNTISVYVSNFPSHLTVRELWNICGKMGKIVDVYIAKHKNKLGQMFDFCRYDKVKNKETLIELLNKVWIGKLRLHANIARFDRNVAAQLNREYVRGHDSHVPKRAFQKFDRNEANSKSYANVVKAQHNGVRKDTEGERGDESSPILLSQEEENSGLSLALIGCYKDFLAIENSKIICQNEGFMDVEIKYLGGLWVLFKFYDRDARDKFLKHEGVMSWFSSLKPWHDDFVVKDRLIWLEVEGVPLLAWNNTTFKQICSRWGEILFIDDSDNSNRLSICVCIKSSHASLVFASIVVMFKGVSYNIRVRELCSWTPKFSLDDVDNEEKGSVGIASNDEGDNIDEFEVDSEGDNPAKEIFQEQNNKVEEQKEVDDTCVNVIDNDPFKLASLIEKYYLNPNSVPNQR